jgi:hypothetical protein
VGAASRRSKASLTAKGKVAETKACHSNDIKTSDGTVSFTRFDDVLPIPPPGALPPRLYVPLEKWSKYWLQIDGLSEGIYENRCQDRSRIVASIGGSHLRRKRIGPNRENLLAIRH